jgi:uncharacterized repeat protein (TIGR03803 family)
VRLETLALVVFAVTLGWLAPAAASEIPLYSFHGDDGAYPYGAVVADAWGNLYGTTPSGGNSDGGVVFELSPPKQMGGRWTETILYRFSVPATRGPFGSLIFDRNGHLFGTTLAGGASNDGSVFELSPPMKPGGNWIERDIYSFLGGNDGALPYAGLAIDGAGALYGTTIEGGGSECDQFGFQGCGTVFRLTPPSARTGRWVEKVLHRFHGDDGREPYAGLIIDGLGNLYGTTIDGGPDLRRVLPRHFEGRPFVPVATGDDGTVFELSPPSHLGAHWTETVLHSFGQPGDGSNPYGGLIFDKAGNLYGTTVFGGLASCFFEGETCGTVFRLTHSEGVTWNESVIYDFPPGARQGAAPYASLTFGRGGSLFGTTQLGGIFDDQHVYGTGTVFELTPDHGAWVQSLLFEFPHGNDGAHPNDAVTFDARDNLFLTASFGGDEDAGSVIELQR